MTIPVVQIGDTWIARCTFAQKDAVKAAGFRWDPYGKRWWTKDPSIAAKLADGEAMDAAMAEAQKRAAEKAASIEASRAAAADIDIPVPDGLEYLPYQRAGIAFAMSRPSTLFGDEMGLGKTIQALGVINTDTTIKRVLVICPASLRLNWAREAQKWLVRPMTVGIAVSNHLPLDADIVIINYDIVDRHKAALQAIDWDLLIVDEAHYLKNPDAKRTQAIVGQSKKGVAEKPSIRARRKLFLTGTPIPNRPVEGWPIFHALDPQEFQSFWGYVKRYCNAYQGKWGWDMTGASNLPQLQDKLRSSIMVRRLKSDVLTELPPKRRTVIEIPANGASEVVRAEADAYEAHEEELESLRAAVELAKASDDPGDYEVAVSRLKAAAQVAFTEMSKRRHEVAMAKIPYLVQHLRDCVDGGSKVVCFAHHQDVIAAILAEFPGYEAVSITGDTPMVARQDAVDRFQTDPTVRLFVGNIQAAGVGITLTASSHVVFAELDWVPGNVTQAEDRCHRIGQRDNVLVQHFVLEGSLDARMAHVLVEKQRVADEALDRQHEAAPVVPTRDRKPCATESATRKQIDDAASQMTPQRIDAVHTCLQMLAGMCDGAHDLDGAGFSKIDVSIGHSLARATTLTPRQAALGAKLVNKYRRQLPAELVATATGKEEK